MNGSKDILEDTKVEKEIARDGKRVREIPQEDNLETVWKVEN